MHCSAVFGLLSNLEHGFRILLTYVQYTQITKIYIIMTTMMMPSLPSSLLLIYGDDDDDNDDDEVQP